MRTRKPFYIPCGSYIIAAMILLAGNAILNAQPFTKITAGQIATDVRDASGASWIDYDGDGGLDLFTSNRFTGNYLYRNQLKQTGAATFERITEAPLGTDLVDGQVWNWIDYDNDGDLDAYLTNYTGNSAAGLRNFLYRNDGGSYTSITSGALATDLGLSLAQVWGDFDNDGDLDVFVAEDNNNGAANKFYQNNGNGTFTRIFTAPFTTDIAPSWGATGGDFDNDGDLDLFVPNVFRTAIQALPHFYRNDLSNGNHWVKLKLVGTSSNRDGIGAKIRARTTINGNTFWQLREASSQNTFCGQNSPEIHFGFGDAAVIDSLKIEWPLGLDEARTNVAVDQVLTITEGTLSAVDENEAHESPENFALYQNYPNPFNPTTNIKFELPAASRVTLKVLDVNGRVVAELVDNQTKAAGTHQINFSGRNLSSGIYFYRLEATPLRGSVAAFSETKAMLLVR